MEQNLASGLTNLTTEVIQAAHEPIIILMAFLVLSSAISILAMYHKHNSEAKSERIAATYGPPKDSQFRPLDY